MDIKVSKPVNMLFDLQEIDDRLPSLKFLVTLISSKFGFDLNVSMTVWIECQCFDDFVKNLGANRIACLSDFEKNFRLEINSDAGYLEWSFSKEGLDGGKVMSLGKELLTADAYGELYSSFYNYPRWW